MSVVHLRMMVSSALMLGALMLGVSDANAASGVSGQLIVGFKPRVSGSQRQQARVHADGRIARNLMGARAQLLTVRRPVGGAAALLRRDRAVAYVQPNYRNKPAWSPDDPGLAAQWNLHNTGQSDGAQDGTPGADIGALDAWDGALGAMPLPVGIVDTGVRFDQPDLGGFWENPGEVPNNGVDDDGNGYVDDVRGYNFATQKPDASDVIANGHGTAVTSIIAARTNNGLEIAGVAPQASVVELNVFASPDAYDSDIAAALDYAGKMPLRVVNVSLGGGHPSPVEAAAISAHPDTLYVAAAGNGDGQGHPVNIDQSPFAPCSEEPDNIICVGATDNRDRATSTSNVGSVAVDLSAPGQRIPAEWTNTGRWAWWSGTSMAAPQVAGTAALLFARHPEASVAQVRRAILDSADRLPELTGLTATGGRLNASRALLALDSELSGASSTEPSPPAEQAPPAAQAPPDEQPSPTEG